MKRFWAGVCVAGLGFCAGCGRSGPQVTLAGSTAFQPFAEKLAEHFMRDNPAIGVTVQGGGSAVGIQSAVQGAADIGMADLIELPPEAAALTAVTVARDGICVIVHPKNTVRDLTLEQISRVYGGQVKRWSEVGGADAPIAVVSREAGSGTRSSFEKILGGFRLTPEAMVQDSNGTVRETVANDSNAIGYISHGLLNERICAVTVDGVDGTTEAIVAGRYPLVRPVFLLTKGEPCAEVKAFLQYALSPAGQALIRDNGLIPAK